MGLMRLHQEVVLNDPVLNSARFNYAANKGIYWQGLSTLLPQVSANPAVNRFFQYDLRFLQAQQDLVVQAS
jgi:outer membrane protein